MYTITEEDGFNGEECLQNGSFKDSKNNIWIGTSDGVVKFDPSKLKIIQNPTDPHFSHFSFQRKDGKEKKIKLKVGEYGQKLTAKSEDKNFEFHFFTINHQKPKSITYRHRLLGHEESWSLPKSPRFVSYNNLPVGTYTFELQSCLGKNYSPIKSLQLEIKPSKLVEFFWFKILMLVLGIFLIVWVSYILYNNFQIKRASEQLALQQLKTQKNLASHKIAPHFIFNILTAFSNLVAKGKKNESLEYIDTFSKLIQPLTQNIGKILKPLKEELAFTQNYLELEKLRFGNRFEYSINLDPSVDLNINVPSMIIHSFVNNAIKHGIEFLDNGGLIQINLKISDEILIVEVLDNGLGIEKVKALTQEYESGEGIKIANDIFNFLNNIYEVKSEVKEIKSSSNGTNVILYINKNYPKQI